MARELTKISEERQQLKEKEVEVLAELTVEEENHNDINKRIGELSSIEFEDEE